VAEETVAILRGSFCQVVDKGLDRFAAGLTQGRFTAVVGGIGLDEGGVKPVLTDQQAETIAKSRLTVVMTIAMAIIFGRAGRRRARGFRVGDPGRTTEFLDRAEPDAICLSEGAVDGAGFCHTHLGAMDERRDVRGVGVAVADEAS